MTTKKIDKWEQKAFGKKPGALHKQLGYGKDKKLPEGLLERIKETPVGNKVQIKGESKKVTLLMKRRVVPVITAEKNRKRK